MTTTGGETTVGGQPGTVYADLTGLTEFATAALCSTGVSEADARIGADVLVRTAARGGDTHGIAYLHAYIDQLHRGGAQPTAVLSTVREFSATLVLDANRGNGLIAMAKATRLAIDRAAEAGCASVLVRGSNHFGAAGHYALMAAESGCIGVVTSNSNPVMAVTGSSARSIGNGVSAYGIPTPSGAPIVLDIALSVVAGGKLRMAQRRGETIEPGLLLAPDGAPSTDPADLMKGGALLPVGGHKGYGLAVFGEVMGGVLSGASWGASVPSWLSRPDTPADIGHMITVYHVEAFLPRADFERRIDEFRTEIRGARRADGVQRIYLPGEIEHDLEQENRRRGLALEPAVWSVLRELADRLGLADQLLRTVRADAAVRR